MGWRTVLLFRHVGYLVAISLSNGHRHLGETYFWIAQAAWSVCVRIDCGYWLAAEWLVSHYVNALSFAKSTSSTWGKYLAVLKSNSKHTVGQLEYVRVKFDLVDCRRNPS